MNPTNGKGSKRRPEDKAKFDENFERIFGKGKPLREIAENQEDLGAEFEAAIIDDIAKLYEE